MIMLKLVELTLAVVFNLRGLFSTLAYKLSIWSPYSTVGTAYDD